MAPSSGVRKTCFQLSECCSITMANPRIWRIHSKMAIVFRIVQLTTIKPCFVLFNEFVNNCLFEFTWIICMQQRMAILRIRQYDVCFFLLSPVIQGPIIFRSIAKITDLGREQQYHFIWNTYVNPLLSGWFLCIVAAPTFVKCMTILQKLYYDYQHIEEGFETWIAAICIKKQKTIVLYKKRVIKNLSFNTRSKITVHFSWKSEIFYFNIGNVSYQNIGNISDMPITFIL